MGLYLCVFDHERGEDVDGVEVGSYQDFAFLRDSIAQRLEGGRAGSRFPTLMLHSDCDGMWSAEEARTLEQELRDVAEALRVLPPVERPEGWQREVARSLGLKVATLYDCYIDVDGEPLIERLIELARVSQATGHPILFQ